MGDSPGRAQRWGIDLRLLGIRPGRASAAVALGVAAQGSALGLAAVAAWLIARAWQMPPVLDLSVAVVAVRALGISRGLCRYLERLVSHDVALRGATEARVGLYRRLAAADPGAVARLDRGELLVRFGRDIDDLAALVVRALIPIVVAVLVSVAAVALIATISMVAAAVLAGALLVAGVLAPVTSARAARAVEQAAVRDRAEAAGRAATALSHAAELRVAGVLPGVLAESAAATRRGFERQQAARRRSAWAAAATPAALAATVLGALFVAQSSAWTEPPTSLAVLVLFPLAAFDAVAQLPAAAHALVAARPVAPELPAGGRAAVAVPDAPPGCRIAIVGPSGSGKTTMLMTLAGLLPAGAEMSSGTTFFAEDAHLFETTVLENLRVARGDITPDEARVALRAVGLGDWLAGLPDGVDTELIGGAAAVSGGQRRRLLLARALLSPAQVLLLDEPTEHLDAEQGADLLRALLDRDSGLVDAARGVVVVTHQLPPDHRADRVIELPPAAQHTDRHRPDELVDRSR